MEESERYQHLELKDYLQELSKVMGAKKAFIKMLRPFLRKNIMKASLNGEKLKES
jgi:hypothetical protein